MPGATRSHENTAEPYSLIVRRFMAEHAIDPAIASRCGVREDNGALIYPYQATNGSPYVRRRRLGPGANDTIQPAGQPLTLWWPAGRPKVRGTPIVICEGESDALAALSALHAPGGDLQFAVCALPGASFPPGRLLEELAATSPGFCLLIPDGDQAGRACAARVLEANAASLLRLRLAVHELPEGQDLADALVALDADGPPAGNWLVNLLLDSEIHCEEQAAAAASAVPVERRVDDRANAVRLVESWQQSIRYQHDEGSWRVWNGVRWAVDDDGQMMRLAMKTAEAIYEEAENASGDDRKQLLRHAQRSGNATRLKAMIQLAGADERVGAKRADFDSQPALLNCANGIVDLATGRLLEHDPELLCGHVTPVAYEPAPAGADSFEAFVAECVGHDADYLDWLRRAVGYSLTASTDEECFFLLHGPGSTGKSTLLTALERAWGTYARSADVAVFVQQQAGRPRNDVARLRDARLVTVTEMDQRADLAAALLKRLTGGDTVAARFLYAEEFEFKPALKLWFASNHLPAVDSRDSGMFRRLRVLPFTHLPKVPRPQLKRDLCDPRLGGPAVLAWAVAGAIDWHRRPLSVDVPEAVSTATETLVRRSDPVGAWLSGEQLLLDPDGFINSRALYKAFLQGLGREDRRPTETEFVRRLKRDGFPHVRTETGNGFAVRLAA